MDGKENNHTINSLHLGCDRGAVGGMENSHKIEAIFASITKVLTQAEAEAVVQSLGLGFRFQIAWRVILSACTVISFSLTCFCCCS